MNVHTYPSLDAMWWEILSFLVRERPGSSRDGDAREICGFVGRYPAEHDWVWNKRRNASTAYAAGELLWYLRGSDDGRIMEAYAPQYSRFLDPDGTAYGAYGKRLATYNQLDYLYRLLQDRPETRQAVLSLWRPNDLGAADNAKHSDIPCTLSLQFLTRDRELNLIVTMRSNDVWLGLPYDGWCFSQLLKIMAAALGVQPGWVQHQAGSMHLYERNFNAAIQAKVLGPTTGEPREGFPDCDGWTGAMAVIEQTLIFEERLRLGRLVEADELKDMGAPSEWLGCIAEHFIGIAPTWLDERLRKKVKG